MKTFLTLSLMSLSLTSFANCGSETVSWPVGVNRNCGDQIIYNGGAQVGATYVAIDAVNSSDAIFKCTSKGWRFESGSCAIKHNFNCISQRLQAMNSDIYYNLSQTEIEEMLYAAGSSGNNAAVYATNLCDKEAP